MTDCRPISCALYSSYEVAILHRTPLRVRWRAADGVIYLETLTPEDLVTRDGEEFLVGHNGAGESRCLRLDQVATIPSDTQPSSA